MGDGDAVRGGVAELRYIPEAEIDRLLALPLERFDRSRLLAEIGRFNTLYMIKRAGSGHVGTCFSSMDLLAWLYGEELELPESGRRTDGGDVFFSSKGHDAPALYTMMITLGLMPFERIHTLRMLGGLPGHPDVRTPQIYANTGSLGMGISKAKGMLAANRLRGLDGRVFVLLGDGELQEGQVWESLQGAANAGTDDLIAIVDANKIQSDTWVQDTASTGDLESKFRAFGWEVARCDGNDPGVFGPALDRLIATTGKPKVLIADTVKGKGVDAFEAPTAFIDDWRYPFHSGAPLDDAYLAAVDQIGERIEKLIEGRFETTAVEQPEHRAISGLQKLVPAYAEALLEAAATDERIVALDADLILDTGLIPFRDRFPDRFIECGIAEQDMVSQAGGLALSGMLPVVHSFASFLSARPNEQIFNNSTEGTKVVYVGSLAGLVPGGPGHSHQCVRDVSALGAIPGLVMVEPCCESETTLATKMALGESGDSFYIRLTSIACEIPFELPSDYRMSVGRGVVIREGGDVVILAAGPVLLAEAWKAAELLAEEGVDVRVVNFPWLNRVDPEWLRAAVQGVSAIFTAENQLIDGGTGDRIAAALASYGGELPPVAKLGLRELPECGKNDEVLRAHGLDADGIAAAVRNKLAPVPS